MKIKAVALMRDVRNKILQETAGMSWEEEREYLRKHSSLFQRFMEQVPNNGATSDQPAPGGVR